MPVFTRTSLVTLLSSSRWYMTYDPLVSAKYQCSFELSGSQAPKRDCWPAFIRSSSVIVRFSEFRSAIDDRFDYSKHSIDHYMIPIETVELEHEYMGYRESVVWSMVSRMKSQAKCTMSR